MTETLTKRDDETSTEFALRQIRAEWTKPLEDENEQLRAALEQISGGSRHVNGMTRKYTAPELRMLAVEALNAEEQPS